VGNKENIAHFLIFLLSLIARYKQGIPRKSSKDQRVFTLKNKDIIEAITGYIINTAIGSASLFFIY